MIAPDGDYCACFVPLVWFELTDNLGIGDFFAAFGGYIPAPYDVDAVGAFNTFQFSIWNFPAPWQRRTSLFD